ncbi:MAG: UDP-N-acetylglucosamine 2-epimerase (non-hydrolyzing) [Victivallales bacterium]|nr:UDP-N-acetylglucosamine 2-epimerase (non-hydrolyzing) [Victivallales bacterium]
MKICTVIGARPQFVKAAAISAVIAERKMEGTDLEEVLVHTGQHYDPAMSDVFFDELGIPGAKYNLNVGSDTHAGQTARMLVGLEKVLINESPEWVLLYGDTNSTLAGALAAAKLHIPIAHVEAGMRSFNRAMPEEVNRVVTDHTADLNFCSTILAVENLEREGRGDTAALVGDVMYDCALRFNALAERKCDPLAKFSLSPGEYILLTSHRAENTNDPARLAGIVSAVNTLAEKTTVLYPMHPRTKSFIEKYALALSERVRTVEPVGYLEMLLLERSAKLILTDSGGIQKEAFFYEVPCVTMRDETEWLETLELGWNKLVGASRSDILSAVAYFAANPPMKTDVKPYGDGAAAAKIVERLLVRK